MAKQITKLISVNGWKNLWTLAVAAGYEGSPVISSGLIINDNAATAYVHITSNGSTNPATASDGFPIDNASSPSREFVLPKGTDICGVWINTSGAQNIKYTLAGS